MREIINQSTIKTIVNRFLELRKKELREKSMGTIMMKRFVSFNLFRFININSHCIIFINHKIYSHE